MLQKNDIYINHRVIKTLGDVRDALNEQAFDVGVDFDYLNLDKSFRLILVERDGKMLLVMEPEG